MRSTKAWILAFLGVIAFAAQVCGGDWTVGQFLYKPSMGARGQADKEAFDAGLDKVDARLGKEIWVGDPNYGTTIAAAVTAIGSDVRTLRVPLGNYNFTADLTIPANITLKAERGALLSIFAGKTLTINGGLEAGLYQIFYDANSDLAKGVKFGPGAIKEVYPQWWGASPGAAKNVNDEAFKKAANSGCLMLLTPPGNYSFNSELDLPRNVSLIGSGREATILDFSSSDGPFANSACIYTAGGGWTALPALATYISKNSRTITFSSAPNVAVGDVLVIYNSADYSYSAWRAGYRAGEYGVVQSISGNEVTLMECTFDYYAAGVSVYKMDSPTSSRIANFQVIGRGAGNATYGLRVDYGRNLVLDSLKVTNSDLTNIQIDLSYNVSVNKVFSSKQLPDINGISYALSLACCQEVRIDDCYLESVRHGLAIGGGGGPVNRNILINNSSIHANNSSTLAADMHGNSEYVCYQNCLLTGVYLAGNHNRLINNIINGSGANGQGISLVELKGFDFTISGNQFTGFTAPQNGHSSFIDCGANSTDLCDKTTEGGTLVISGNKAYYTVPDGAQSLIKIANYGCTATDLNVMVTNNTLIGTKTSRGNDYGLNVQVNSGSYFNSLVVQGNFLRACGLFVYHGNSLVIKDNLIEHSGMEGIRASTAGVGSSATICNNTVKFSRLTGIFLSGLYTSYLPQIKVNDNISIENAIASGSYNANLWLQYASAAYVGLNVLGGSQAQQQYPAVLIYLTSLYETRNEYYGTGATFYVGVTNQYGQLQAANPDTSGATLTQLEAEVNQLKAALRASRILTP